jgi:hypothetical protein
MSDLRKAAQQSLAWIHYHRLAYAINEPIEEKNLRAALAQQEQKQEPVASAWIHDGVMVNAFPWPPGDPRGYDGDQYWQGKGYAASPLYTHPPRREWQSLTEEEREQATGWSVEHIEAKLKEKNNG